MFLIGGRGQPIRTRDGVIHLVTPSGVQGVFAQQTPCGIDWRRTAEYAPDDAIVNCMTCMVHEARS